MTFAKQVSGAAALAAVLLLDLAAPSAQAGYVETLTEQGGNVVATGSGTFDLTALTFYSHNVASQPFLTPNNALLGIGTTILSDDAYTGVSAPAQFGSGPGTNASSGSGDAVAIVGIFTEIGLLVPAGYTSDTPLMSGAVWDNASFMSLGVTPGTYEWTWGSGADADSFTLEVPVPEPSSLALLVLPPGFLMLLAALYHRAMPQHLRAQHNRAKKRIARNLEYERAAGAICLRDGPADTAARARPSRSRRIGQGRLGYMSPDTGGAAL